MQKLGVKRSAMMLRLRDFRTFALFVYIQLDFDSAYAVPVHFPDGQQGIAVRNLFADGRLFQMAVHPAADRGNLFIFQIESDKLPHIGE
ncbi:hypothetical protein D3C71_1899110 [compost metagenome]